MSALYSNFLNWNNIWIFLNFYKYVISASIIDLNVSFDLYDFCYFDQ